MFNFNLIINLMIFHLDGIPCVSYISTNSMYTLMITLSTHFLVTWPSWEDDFRWSNRGPIQNKKCVQIVEAGDRNGWHDNFLCWDQRGKKNLDVLWSSEGWLILRDINQKQFQIVTIKCSYHKLH